MAYDASNIIPINVAINAAGLGYANFGSAVLFAPEGELPAGFSTDTRRVYSSITELSADFPSTTQTYQAANRWLGGIPATNSLTVWGVADADATITDTLNKARDEFWWFFSFFTAAIYADAATVTEIAEWSNSVGAFFVDCQTAANATAIRTPATTDDIATTLTTSGYRFAATVAHETDAYAGIALCKWFAAVNYSATNSTITGEFKKLSGVAAEDLTSTAQSAMLQATKKCAWYSVVDLQGSVDSGRMINTYTHSTYGEYWDDVINLAAFTNRLQVDLYNAVANIPTKLGQDPVGQAVLIGTAKSVCETFIANGYLGSRNYLDPDDGQEKFTVGYEILTKAEDILDLSDADRAARLAAPLRIRIFRKGAIHKVPVDVTVY